MTSALQVARGLKRFIPPKAVSIIDQLTGAEDIMWSRVVMRAECKRLIENLNLANLNVLEISGTYWGGLPFKSYKNLLFPGFDICNEKDSDKFDLIIAEQVFEHLLWPYRAARNVFQMLNDGGHFLVSTPFLLRIHEVPVDCSRWTETGLRYFLAECGFDLAKIQTGAWGNRACVKANLDLAGGVRYRRRLHSLKNEPDVPYHVWAFASK